MEVFWVLLTSWSQQHPPHQTTNPQAEFKINTLAQQISNTWADKQAWVVKSYNKLYYLLIAGSSYFYLHLLRPHRPWRRSAAQPMAIDHFRKHTWAKWRPKNMNMATCAKQHYSYRMTLHSLPASLCRQQFEMVEWNEEVEPYYTIIALTLRFIVLREIVVALNSKSGTYLL